MISLLFLACLRWKKERNEWNVAYKWNLKSLWVLGFPRNVKTIRDFPQVSGRNALLIFLSKIERMERGIVPHFAWHSDTNHQIIMNLDNCSRQEIHSSCDYRCSNRNTRYNLLEYKFSKAGSKFYLVNITFSEKRINVCHLLLKEHIDKL